MGTAEIGDWLIEPPGWGGEWPDRLLGFVDLAACPASLAIRSLPPFPLIGLGPGTHPLAGRMDAVVEHPVSAGALIRGIEAAPRAAAVLVQLLRSMGDRDIASALSLESMAMGLLQGSAEHAAWLARQPAALPLPAGEVQLSRQGDRLGIRLQRPLARNAIDRAMRDGLREAFTLAALDADVRRIRLTGDGASFSVGADLAEFGTTRDPATAQHIRMTTLPARALADFDGTFEAHVQGACIGAGLELAAFAQRIVATPDAWFQLPELGMGILPGAGGCVSVPGRIGRQRAALMILSGRRISASTALDWGLIDAIVDTLPGAEDSADQV